MAGDIRVTYDSTAAGNGGTCTPDSSQHHTSKTSIANLFEHLKPILKSLSCTDSMGRPLRGQSVYDGHGAESHKDRKRA